MKYLPQVVRKSSGFTLIELLVVIGILAVLLAIVLIAINPARQFAQANNTQRKSDVNAILSAVHQYMAENNGTPPAGITATDAVIGTDDGAGAAEADLCADLVATFIADLPLDPTDGVETPEGAVCNEVGVTYNTGYTIVTNADNRITVTAPGAELGETITVTR